MEAKYFGYLLCIGDVEYDGMRNILLVCIFMVCCVCDKR